MKSKKLYSILISVMLCLIMMFSATACSDTENETTDTTVDSISVTSELLINVNEERTLRASVMPFGSKATVTWKSSDDEVATVTQQGVVKGVGAGVAKIRATAGGKSANCEVTVVDPSQTAVAVKEVSLNKNVLNLNLDVEAEKTFPLEAKITPTNASNQTVTWKSSKSSVATVSDTGFVTAVAPGSALITATAHNGTYAYCFVTVTGAGSEAASTLNVRKISELEDRSDFIMGMDASAVPSLEAAGFVYKDMDGVKKDVFVILKENGITDIRIRVWNDPYQEGHSGEQAYSYGGGNCDINNAVAIAARCKEAGLGVIIDFHYSDFWADPGKQSVPKAWKNLDVAGRKQAIYDFTYESLNKIKETQVKITMVQVGNETTSAICGASYATATADYCAYINEGARAVRAATNTVANGGAKVAIHLTNPEKGNFSDYATAFKTHEVDYDVFGTSYYPFWHGSLTNLSAELKKAHDISGKQVMVLETSYAFTDEDFDGNGNTQLPVRTRPFTVQGQSNAIWDVINTVAKLDDYGLGVCYWEGTWVAPATDKDESLSLCNTYGCGWASAKSGPASIGGDGYQANDVKAAGGVVIDNQAFFSSIDGKALESLQVFKLVKTGQVVDPIADYIYTAEVFCTVNEGEIALPKKVKVILNEGSTLEVDALWNIDDDEVANYIHIVDDYTITGTTPYGGVAVCKIYVQNKNILVDGSFEDTEGLPQTDKKVLVPSPWEVERIAKEAEIQLYVSNDEQNAKMGTQSFHFWDSNPIEFRLYQAVNLDKAIAEYSYGVYSFSVDFAGGDCGDEQDIYSYAIITYNDGTEQAFIRGTTVKATGWKQWSRSSIAEIVITKNVQSVKVGINVTAGKGGWGNIDNAQFFFKSALSG
ncbi:MAG: glycosyl hydrolase 53 family protein [Clostridiales bacterium]|nr:glycosyl hydrolase 53 family protein [Clostridiales bacterium]